MDQISFNGRQYLLDEVILPQVHEQVPERLTLQIMMQIAAPIDARLDLHGQLVWELENFGA